jgi:hypothetical protein
MPPPAGSRDRRSARRRPILPPAGVPAGQLSAARAATPDDAETWLTGAERHAQGIEGERTAWGDALALVVGSSVAAARGQATRAVALAEAAESALAAADMPLHMAAVRRRRGEMIGGDGGRDLVAAADAWMTAQAIRNPARMAGTLVPRGRMDDQG